MFRALLSSLFDFLYPKDQDVLKLESLEPEDLLTKLTPAKGLSNDTYAIWNYADEKVRLIIWEIKYRRNEKLIENVTQVLYDIVTTEILEREVTENFINPLLIPIPISKRRKLERGYNQTELLCKALRKLDTENLSEYLPTALQRVVHTESQTHTKNKKERIDNMSNTMEVRDSKLVKDRNVILIDDVTTTGATLGDARRALRESGAKKIICFALAH
jgi:ComF family protein